MDAPGSNFDTLKDCAAFEIGTNAYQVLVASQADIADHDGILNGWVLSPKGQAVLLNAVDGNKRPLFINSVAEGAVPMILGSRVMQSKGAYIADSTGAKKNVVGFAGDWTQAVYGTVEGVQIALSDQATLTDGSTTINLFQQNMFAVRAEIENGPASAVWSSRPERTPPCTMPSGTVQSSHGSRTATPARSAGCWLPTVGSGPARSS